MNRWTTSLGPGRPRARPTMLLLASALLLSACESTYTRSKSHTHTVEYDDPVELAEAHRQLDSLREESIRRRYRLLSSSYSTDGSGAEQTTVVLVGREPGLGAVELRLEWWDRIRPDQPEVRVGVSAELPPSRQGEAISTPPEWTALLERIQVRVWPRYF
jgi:hypothetical protein